MLIRKASLQYIIYGDNVAFIVIERAAHCADVKPVCKVAGRQSQKKFAELSAQDGMYNIIIISQTTPHKLSPLQIIWLLNLI